MAADLYGYSAGMRIGGNRMVDLLKWCCVLVIIVFGISFPAQAAVQQAQMTPTNPGTAFDRELIESINNMDRAMMAVPMTGDPDADFSAIMTMHHQSAIDMAKAYLAYGKDPVLRQMAQNIIVTQQQEIELMRGRQAALKTNASNISSPAGGLILAQSGV